MFHRVKDTQALQTYTDAADELSKKAIPLLCAKKYVSFHTWLLINESVWIDNGVKMIV